MVLPDSTHHFLGVLVMALYQCCRDEWVGIELTTLLPGDGLLGPQQQRVNMQHANVVQQACNGRHLNIKTGQHGCFGEPCSRQRSPHEMQVQLRSHFSRNG